MSKFLSYEERKAKEEKKNELITRAESVVNTAKEEKRELTDDEMQELAEIRDDVRKIKEFLKLESSHKQTHDKVAVKISSRKRQSARNTQKQNIYKDIKDEGFN